MTFIVDKHMKRDDALAQNVISFLFISFQTGTPA